MTSKNPFAFAGSHNQHFQPGMSLRDYFAGQALMGILANPNVIGIPDKEVVRAAYLHANNMLAERTRQPKDAISDERN